MKTQVDQAKNGNITPEMEAVAKAENKNIEFIAERVAEGSVVIMSRGERSTGIGKGLSTKVNVNIGTSTAKANIDEEIAKAKIAEKYGADTITELSMGGNIAEIRKAVFENTTLPITTVPIYQTAAEIGLENMTCNDLIKEIKNQAKEGVSSIVLHCVDSKMVRMLKNIKRISGVVSKGGSITIAYMMLNRCENPFIENFDTILKILKRYDIVLSLGNAMRSGCIHDIRDKVQLEEIKLNIKLAKLANQEGVQVIIEGTGGHVAADRIAEQVRFYKRRSVFPLFVSGPLPTDIALGYDHIAGSIGAAIASGAGADYLCYITPNEHIGLPGIEQVKEGLIAFRIASHIGDSIKYGLSERDKKMAERRAMLDWEGQLKHALYNERAKKIAPEKGACTMCGDFCAIKIMKRLIT